MTDPCRIRHPFLLSCSPALYWGVEEVLGWLTVLLVVPLEVLLPLELLGLLPVLGLVLLELLLGLLSDCFAAPLSCMLLPSP